MFSQELVNRVATMTVEDVNNLPKVHIKDEGVLFQLMAWRNRHKDLVRGFKPVINEGTISAGMEENFQYFNQEGDDIFHMNKTSEKLYVAFKYNTKTWEMTPIANTIDFYPSQEVHQDLITVHATVMAYLTHIGVKEIKQGEVVNIDKVVL